jgi:YggT family protein
LATIASILLWVLNVFRIALVGRLIIDWIRAINPSFKPKGFFLVVAELFYLATDWAIKPLNRVIKPIKTGSVYIDISILVLFGLVFLAQVVLTSLT